MKKFGGKRGGGGGTETKTVCQTLSNEVKYNKTCHRDKIARLTAPCPSHEKT